MREKREKEIKVERKERGKCLPFLGFAQKREKREGMVAL
jgi:hypothetical protein